MTHHTSGAVALRRDGLMDAPPEPGPRPARSRPPQLEVRSAFDFASPNGKPSIRVAKEFGIAIRAKHPRMSSLVYVPELHTFYAAREDGSVVQWRTRVLGDERVGAGMRMDEQNDTVRVTQARPAFALRGHVGKVHCLLSLQPVLGRFTHGALVSGGADSSICVWDPRKLDSQHAVLQHLKGHNGGVLCLEQCVDLLVSGGRDGTVRLWGLVDFRKNKNKRDSDVPSDAKNANSKAPMGVVYALFTPLRVLCVYPGGTWGTSLRFGCTTAVGDHGTLFVGLSDGNVRKIKAARARVAESDDDDDHHHHHDDTDRVSSTSSPSSLGGGNTQQQHGFSNFVNAAAPAPASFAEDAKPVCFFSPNLDTETDPELGKIHVATAVTQMRYYPNEGMMLVLGRDCVARLLSCTTGVILAQFEDAHGARFIDGVVSRDDPAEPLVLYLCDSFGTLRVYDISDTTNIDPLQDPLVKTHLTGFVKGHGMDDTLNVGDRVPAAGVVLVHHAKCVAVLSEFGRVTGVRVTRADHFELVENGGAHDGRVTVIAVAETPDWKRGEHGENKENDTTLRDDDDDDLEDDLVFTASVDGSLKQRDPFDLVSIRRYDLRELVGDEDATHPKKGTDTTKKGKRKPEKGSNDVTSASIALQSGGKSFLLTGHDDGSLRVWDALSGKTVCTKDSKKAHCNAVTGICQLSDYSGANRGDSRATEKSILTAGFDGRLCLWRISGVEKPPELKKTWRAHGAGGEGREGSDQGSKVESDQGSEKEILSVTSFHAAPFVAISSGNDLRVKFWKGANDLLCAFAPHKEPTTAVASFQNKLVTGSEDGLVKVWDCARVADASKGVSSISTTTANANGAILSTNSTTTKSNTSTATHANGALVPILLFTLDPACGPVRGVYATRSIDTRRDAHYLVTCSGKGVCVWDFKQGAGTAEAVMHTHETMPADENSELAAPAEPSNVPESVAVSLRARSLETRIERDFEKNEEEDLLPPPRPRCVSQNHRLLSKFQRNDDVFTCFAVRPRCNQILVGTASGRVIALDAFKT